MIKKIIITAFFLFLASPVLVYAQPATSTATTPTGLPEYSGVDSSITEYLCTPTGDGKDLERCINRLYRFGITAGAIILVAMVVFAGYLYITSGETGKGKAKSMLMNSLVGMAMLLGSYALLYFINPSLVAFRAIQPPIFSVADLPECAAIGLGEDCIVSEDSASVTSAKGAYADCPDGVINFDKSAVPVNGGGDTEKVCKALMEKLKLIHAQQKITVTATIGPGHDSNCHKPGNSKSGVCADMAPQNGNYEDLCSVITSVGGLAILNESGKSGPKCGTFVKTRLWSGAHLHIWLTTGTGGGTSSGGGVNSSCTKGSVPGICANPLSNDRTWPDEDWDNTDSGLRTAYNNLVKKYGSSIPLRQVYRSPAYAAHLRSIWEASQFVYKTKHANDTDVKTFGQNCNGRSSSFVTSAIASSWTPTQITEIKRESGKHGFSGGTESTTCSSDHDKGIAFDIDKSLATNSTALKRIESLATQVGLCHDVVGDEPHFALKSKIQNPNVDCLWYTNGKR